MTIFHTGKHRASTDVNAVWLDLLRRPFGFRLFIEKLEIAYQFREGLRTRDWPKVQQSISDYAEIRTELCPAYLEGSREIKSLVDGHSGVCFPLGAGGGGGVLVFCSDPADLDASRAALGGAGYREIPFTIRSRGHQWIHSFDD